MSLCEQIIVLEIERDAMLWRGDDDAAVKVQDEQFRLLREAVGLGEEPAEQRPTQ